MLKDIASGTEDLWRHRPSLVFAGAALLGLLVFCTQTIRYNPTPSIPMGYYYKTDLPEDLEVGQRVYACLSGEAARLAIERHYIPQPFYAFDCTSWRNTDTNVTAIAKRILAVPGDTVRLDTTGLYIRGKKISGAPFEMDSKGRPVIPLYGTHVVERGHFWIGSKARLAYDSRYFGPVARRQLVGSPYPLWTWPGTPAEERQASPAGPRIVPLKGNSP